MGGLGFRRLSSVIQDRKKSIVDRLLDSPRLVCMAVSEMLEKCRLLWDSARKVVLWGDSLSEYAASSNQCLRLLADILDLGLDLSLVDFLGDHPLLLGDLASNGALRQGDLTCCAPSGCRIWAPLCVEDSMLSAVMNPPQGLMTFRSGQFRQVYSDLDRGCIMRK